MTSVFCESRVNALSNSKDDYPLIHSIQNSPALGLLDDEGRKSDIRESIGGDDVKTHEFQSPATVGGGGEEYEDEGEMVPPDGGFAWWVLFASIVVNILIPGTVKSFGVLFVEFMEVFQATPAEAAWIPAISFFLYSSTSPFASALAIRFSDRLVTMVGGFLAATGLCLSYFATSVTHLCLTYGVVGGLGSGLAYPIGVFIVARYFEGKRGFANGLCTSGSALGSILMPQLLQILLRNYGYRKTVVVVGCLLLNVCIVALFYDPVEKHLKRKKYVAIPTRKQEVADEVELATIVQSEPIPIPRHTRPVFEVGQDTPPGEPNWSPQYDTRLSPLMNRPWRDENCHRYRPFTGISSTSTSDPSTLPTMTHSKLNLAAIPEDGDDAEAERRFFSSLQSPKQQLTKLSVSISSAVHGHGFDPPQILHPISAGEIGMSRTLSLASNESTSSFRYVATIHHGPLLAALQSDDINRIHSSGRAGPSLAELHDGRRRKDRKRKLFDFSLLSSPFFIIFLISCGTTAVSYTNFIILLPSYAHEKGFDKAEGSYLLSMVATLDFVGRVGGATLSDLKLVSREWFFVLGVLCSGVTLSLIPLATSLSSIASLCACFGLFSGTYIGVTAVILAERLGSQRLGSSFSISLFLNGILQLGGPPICGVLFQELHTNEPILISLGILLILGSSLWLLVPFLPPETLSLHQN